MSVQKTPNGRFRAKLKSGRVDVASRVFDTQREAKAWLARERAALAGGVDPRAGRQRVRLLVVEWLEVRRTTVAAKTYRADQDLLRLMPTSMLALHVSAVSGREVARSFEALLAAGLAESSVRRYRASLSSFFAWCVREKLVLANPVIGVTVPKQSGEVEEMDPFSEEALEEVHAEWSTVSPHLADLLLLLAWTGLRWAEARAMRVEDVMRVPTPGLLVRRSQPEGQPVKATKGRRSRRVPLANRVLPIVLRLTEGKAQGDLLFTTERGSQLHRSAVLRTLNWSTTGRGRRVHDLRHTAACLWLSRGVDPGTVQAWMGHESIATTNRYLHFLGTGADRAGLERLNSTPGGTRGADQEARSE
ncbi:tyrosine-type recombinase/integrase [Janibacter sp. G349]